MQLIDGRAVYSATDLVGYLACEHLTTLDRAVLAGLIQRPRRRDAELEVIQKRGLEHEQRYLAELRSQGRRIVEIRADDGMGQAPPLPDPSAGSPSAESAGRTGQAPPPPGGREEYGERLRQEAAATRAAMTEAADVIYQATFFDGRWVGHADFLLRVEAPDRPSRFGSYHYEVADTKLARHVKASALLQICSYVDQLEAVQGLRPRWMHVVLGGAPRRTESFRVDDFLAYYRMARRRFEAAVRDAPSPQPSPARGEGVGVYFLPAAPEPVEHCDVCRWAEACDRRRHADDHLSLVAGISRGQRRDLTDRGIDTLSGLARLHLPLDPPLTRTSRSALERVREQARIQAEGREAMEVRHELLLPVETNKGLASLPPPSPGDLFLDLEGDSYALDNGLDYLFGVLEPSRTGRDGDPFFHAFWSHDTAGTFSLTAEKAAFEATVDLIMDRLAADPALHVYHYAPYEPTAFKRLMSRYGTREEEVDRLLRGGIFVDLYRVVRQGLRASVESYSIKQIERLYGLERNVALRDATSSIVEFETWLRLGEGERPGADHLDQILQYNRDDVLSTWRLRNWLESQRAELEASGATVPRPTAPDAEPSAELAENLRRTAGVAERLTADVPVDLEDRDGEQQARWLLAQLLSWHRREEKSTWWRFFHLMKDLTDEERIEEKEPIGGLEPVRVVEESRQSRIYRYRFPAQEHSVQVGSTVHDPATGKASGTVEAIDEAAGIIDLRRSKKGEVPHPTSVVPLQHFDSGVQRESLLRLGSWVAERGMDGGGSHAAAVDLLRRAAPRPSSVVGEGNAPSPQPSPARGEGVDAPPSQPFGRLSERGVRRPDRAGSSPARGEGVGFASPARGEGVGFASPARGEGVGFASPARGEGVGFASPARGEGVGFTPLREPGEDILDAARRLALALDHSALPIQGPPGSGKTYTGARMIVALVAAGKRVGITANSHKVIANLLAETCRAAAERGVDVTAIQKAEPGEMCADPHVVRAKTNQAVPNALASGEANVAAGTAWLWARPEMEGAVDVLFVDEAGQFSLANALAVAHATRSLVLLGDPQQLDQPLQGVHPPGAEASALAHLLGAEATMPPDRGLFLETTWRLHPDVCAFTSEAFYEGKLVPEPHLARQRVDGPALEGTGLRLIEVSHQGNENASQEEATLVAGLARDLVEGSATWMDKDGVEQKIGWDDVLIVAPYNAQVGAIQRLLPPQARVGTVDKFQGQEAPISIYSMATSSPEEAPRGMTFLYSRNRLNVATSRARCAAVLVCSPDLLRVQAHTPDQMRLANALCQFVERAKGWREGASPVETNVRDYDARDHGG